MPIVTLVILVALSPFFPASAAQENSRSVPRNSGSDLSPGASSNSASGNPSDAPADTSKVSFAGEVLRGQWYEHDIGHGLVFRLTPSTTDEGGGWVIEISPKTQPADGPAEFSAIATPPYHFYNQRYLEAAYSYSAKEAVQISPRKFYFVETLADEHLANDVVNAALYPSASTEQEKARIAAEADGVNLCRGELRIVHSKLSPGKGGDPDTIASVKFEVALDFSPGLTLQRVLAPAPPSPPPHK